MTARTPSELESGEKGSARAMADRWDAAQCPARWEPRAEPVSLFGDAA